MNSRSICCCGQSSNLLLILDRPLIYMAVAIPSSLHKKVKFISGDKVISVMVEEDVTVPSATGVPNLEAQQVNHPSLSLLRVSDS